METQSPAPTRSLAEPWRQICRRCGHAFETPIWLIVDLEERPDLLPRLLDGSLHQAICPHCDASHALDAPLLVHDPVRERLLFAAQASSAPAQARRIARELGTRLIAALPRAARAPYLTRALHVRGLRELQRLLRENATGDALSAALPALMQATTPAEVQALVHSHPVLGTAEARAHLRDYVSTLQARGEASLARALQQRLEALAAAPDTRVALLHRLLHAGGPEQRQAVLARQPSIPAELPAMFEALAVQAERRGLAAVAHDLRVIGDETRRQIQARHPPTDRDA
ncbi:CpXC domain-containing protein [Kallotenue papyrolyticum]|uniref:CpXC domain-containing protein n=1 Tax=Kallotenue papyrolyticum TaxID=1325125 RepID=UPI0004B76409|nr:CpXC domain-containing protein [Kallotenue papyrolyticum]